MPTVELAGISAAASWADMIFDLRAALRTRDIANLTTGAGEGSRNDADIGAASP